MVSDAYWQPSTLLCHCASPLAELLQVAPTERHVHLQSLDAVVESHKNGLFLVGAVNQVPVLLGSIKGLRIDV